MDDFIVGPTAEEIYDDECYPPSFPYDEYFEN